MNSELLQKYQILANKYQSKCDSNKKRLKLISYARLISFLGIIPTYYYLNPANGILALSASFLLLTAFLFLIKKSIQAEKQMFFYQYLAEINLDEISV